jgi:hypothetical protein
MFQILDPLITTMLPPLSALADSAAIQTAVQLTDAEASQFVVLTPRVCLLAKLL